MRWRFWKTILHPVTVKDTARTGPHRHVEKILDVLGIGYMSEESFPPYVVDIYLPEWHLGIEIDGPFHYKNKDEVRDKFLAQYFGLPILRFNVKAGWVTRTRVQEEVVRFIEEYEPTTKERKALSRGKR